MMQLYVPNPQRVRKVGNSLVVTIPADLAEQHDIKADDLVRIILEPVEQVTIPRLPPDVQGALDQVLEQDQDALRYLGGLPASTDSSP
jgi:antitoxin component of MazEF toxin-antitoxin module